MSLFTDISHFNLQIWWIIFWATCAVVVVVGPSGDGGSWTLTVGSAFSDDGRSLLDVIWPAVVGGTAPYATHAGDSSAHPSLYTHWCYASASCCILQQLHQQNKKGTCPACIPSKESRFLFFLHLVATSPPTGCSNVSPGHSRGWDSLLSPTARSLLDVA